MACIAHTNPDECGGGVWTTQTCYQPSTGKLLTKWECGLCHQIIYTHSHKQDIRLCTYGSKDCDAICPYYNLGFKSMPCMVAEYATLGEFVAECRKDDYHFMALERRSKWAQ